METKVAIKEILLHRSTLENLKKEFIAFDLETTGFSPLKDRIVEIGAVKFVNGRAKDPFSTLVHSNVPISWQASRVNGITNEILSSAPSESEAISKLVEFLGDALQGKTVLCAHNANFDMKFLQVTLERTRINAEIYYVDTLSLARTHIKGLDNYKQDTVLKHFNFSNIQAHRAQTDALGCGKILCKLFPLMETNTEKNKRPQKRKVITDEEMQICIYLKSLLIKQGAEYLEYLRCDKTTSGYVRLTCLYPFITFKIMRQGKFIIIPKSIAKKKIMGEPCTKNEALDCIRYYFDTTSMLDIFGQ